MSARPTDKVLGTSAVVPAAESRLGARALLRGGPIIALIGLCVYLSLVTPYVLTWSNLINVARQTSISIILAVGQTLIIIGAGIDLSVGAVLALSGCFTAVAVAYWGWPVWIGIPAGLALGAFLGMINGIIIAKGRIPDFIATLGMTSVARGAALLLTGGLPVPSHLTATTLAAYLPSFLIWLGSGSVFGIPTAALVALAVAVLGHIILRHTILGRSAYAIGGNREAARISGIDVERHKIYQYSFMGLLAAIAGLVLTGRLNSANALMAEGMELQSIAAVVIGGTNLFGGEGSVAGTVIGALIMGVLANGLNLLNVSAFWQRIVMGSIIIAVVVFDQWRRRRFGS
ncbi:MAG: ABC transporter permease [Firmicutes bacterium]|nr:ABC transporter permease [Bacillota bacterium]